MELEHAFRVLGVPVDTAAVRCWDPYQQRRGALLAEGADPKGAAIRELDDAYIRIRDEHDLARELHPYLTAVLDIQFERTLRLALGSSAGPTPGGAVPLQSLHVIPIGRDADLHQVVEAIGMTDPDGPPGYPARIQLPDGSEVDAYALPQGDADQVSGWARAFRAPLIYSLSEGRLVAVHPGRRWTRNLSWTATDSPVSSLEDRLSSYLIARRIAEEKSVGEARQLERQRLEEARRDAEERSALLAAGWPAAWATPHLRTMAEAGADPANCASLCEAGWTPVEVAAAASRLAPGADVPPGKASQHRKFGDSLRSLLDGGWPPTPAGTVLSRKDLSADGSPQRRWVIYQAEAELVLVRFDRDATPSGWSCHAVASRPDLSVLSATAPDAFTLSADSVTLIVTDTAMHDETLELLRFDLDHDPQIETWPPEAARAWSARSAALRRETPDIILVSLWCSLNDEFVVGVQAEEGARVVTLDLTSLERGGSPEVTVTTLAHHSWFSESGGAPVSWDGGNELVLATPGVIVSRQWGDFGPEASVLDFDGRESSLIERLVDWVEQETVIVHAALRLEPLDPDGRLPASEREHWEGLLADLEVTFWIEAPERSIDEVRQRLAAIDPTYAKVAAALSDPTTSSGAMLRQALERVAEDGVLGHLRAWASADRRDG